MPDFFMKGVKTGLGVFGAMALWRRGVKVTTLGLSTPSE